MVISGYFSDFLAHLRHGKMHLLGMRTLAGQGEGEDFDNDYVHVVRLGAMETKICHEPIATSSAAYRRLSGL